MDARAGTNPNIRNREISPGDMKRYEEYHKALSEHDAAQAYLKERHKQLQSTKKIFERTENDVLAMSTVGQIIGEVLKGLPNDTYIVKTSQGPRYVVGCKGTINRSLLVPSSRVALDLTTLTIMKVLPREVDPSVYAMADECKDTSLSWAGIGGLKSQIRELREVIELPLKNPDVFKRVGIHPPKGVLLYGPPGTGKTLLAKAIASTLDVNFMKVVASALIEKYIGESSRMIREMFAYAKERRPCVIFLDEIDAIGGKRTSDSSSSDREVQRTLMELLNQMDGFKDLSDVKIIVATNRPDILDPALMRPGRLDRKIEIPLPNDQARIEILKIHSEKMEKVGDVDYNELSKLTDSFNGADLRNVCTEAGMFALREERDYVVHEDFIKSARKVADAKKLEGRVDYKKNLRG